MITTEKIQNERLCQELFINLSKYVEKQPKFRKYYEKTNKTIEECVKYLKQWASKYYRDGDCAYMTPSVVYMRTMRYFMDDNLAMPNDVKPAPATTPAPSTTAKDTKSKKGKGKQKESADLFANVESAESAEEPKKVEININLTTDEQKAKEEPKKDAPTMEICGGKDTDINFDEDDL